MLRRQRHIRTQIQKFVDSGLFALSFWLAHLVRMRWLKFEVMGGTKEIEPFEFYLWVFFFIIPLSLFLFESQGFYNRPSPARWRQTLWQILKVSVMATIGIILMIYLLREQQIARSVVILFGGLSFLLVAVKEALMHRWLQSKIGQEQLKKRLILVGSPEDTARLRYELERTSSDIEILDQLNVNNTSVEHLIDLVHEHSANGVVLSAQHTYFGQIEKVIQACELEGVEAWLLADFFKTQISQTSLDDFYGRPMLVFRSAPETSWQSLAKQIFDILGALVLLIVLAIPLLIVSCIIRFNSPGPALFRQKRSGLNGRPFTMYKFRSMVTDAEQRKHELEVLNEMGGPVFKVSNDPRITSVGRILRKYSIDELPQLVNVLRGEMSMVGPRPLPVDEVRRFDDLAHRRRLSVKPGLTCLWQISGRNDVKDFRDWVRLDLEYIDNWSLWLDFKILVRTIPIVLTGTGAK